MAFQLVQSLYWIALATWFGGAVFVAVAAGAVFRVIGEEKPVLAQVLAVNLEDQHGVLLGSAIMSRLLGTVGRVQLVAGVVVMALLVAHFAVADTRGQTGMLMAVVRLCLAVPAVSLAVYERFTLFPRLAKNRQTYIDHADEPEVANPAKDAFDRDQGLTLTLILVTASLLAGLVLFSATIVPAPTYSLVSGGR